MRSTAKLEKYLHERLGSTEDLLRHWQSDRYSADGRIVSKFWEYIRQAPAIIVIGDYDCDGICASHILSQSVRSQFPQKKVKVRIPHRFSEGYGINDAIADEIIRTMPAGSLIITVDNGIAAAPVLERLKENGYKVIVTDHHQLREGCEIPKVDMVIDPAVKELPNALIGDYWCGAAVALKLCEAVIPEELATELSAYAGIATVADCMELVEGNWGLVRNTIQLFRDGKAPYALTNLLRMIEKDPNFCNEDDFGYYLGPMFNAPGRLLDAGAIEVLKYLYKPTKEGAEAIISLNERRKELAEEQTNRAIAFIEDNHMENDCPLWVNLPGLHEGIVGIIAGRLAETYKRPTVVLTDIETKPGLIKGSARGYGRFNVFEYLSTMPELFVKMGGHAGAAGLTMEENNFELARKHRVPVPVVDRTEDMDNICLPIQHYEIPEINKSLDKFRPFGQGNAAPEFDLEVDFRRDKVTMIGKEKNHLSINAGKYKIMHFRHVPNELANPERFGMTGHIGGSAFMGHEIPQFTATEVYDIIDQQEKGR